MGKTFNPIINHVRDYLMNVTILLKVQIILNRVLHRHNLKRFYMSFACKKGTRN